MLRLIYTICLCLLPVFLYFIPLDWLNEQRSICLFKNIFDVECYGCGLTRATISAIQFKYVAAYNYNKLIIIVFPLLTYLWAVRVKLLFVLLKNKFSN